MSRHMELAGGITRRGFLKTSAAAAGAAALGDLRMAHGAGELAK